MTRVACRRCCGRVRFRAIRRRNRIRATAPTAVVSTVTLSVVITMEINAAVIISMIVLCLPNRYRWLALIVRLRRG